MKRAALALLVACSSAPPPPAAITTPPPAPEPTDTTAPRIASRWPAIGDSNAFASGPFRLTFDEAVAAATVTTETIRLWQETGRVPAAVTLAADGKTVSIRPAVALRVPGWAYVEVTTGVHDLAGNHLVAEATPWTFQLAEWVSVGGPGPISPVTGFNPHASVAIDSTGAIVVGMANLTPNPIVRFADGAWAPLPDVPFSIWGSIVGDSAGQIWQADGFSMQVNHLEPAGWAGVGSTLSRVSSTAYVWDPHLVIREGTPIFTWEEYEPAGGATMMHARAWNGSAWVGWGDTPGPVLWPRVAAGPTGAVVASWNAGAEIRAAWLGPLGFDVIPERVNGASGTAGTTAVGAGRDGRPIVVYGEPAGAGQMAIRVKAWTGAAWMQLGDDLNPSAIAGPTTPALAIDSHGLPVVAWTEGGYAPDGIRQLYVARYDGARWAQLGGSLNVDPAHDVYEVALALDSADAPVLAWAEHTGELRSDGSGNVLRVYAFHVKRLNH